MNTTIISPGTADVEVAPLSDEPSWSERESDAQIKSGQPAIAAAAKFLRSRQARPYTAWGGQHARLKASQVADNDVVEVVAREVLAKFGPEAEEAFLVWALGAPGTDRDAVREIVWRLASEMQEAGDEVGRVSAEPICEDTVPPRKWVVSQWLSPGHSTLFAGGGGLGKTNVALELALCVANGYDWFDEPVLQQGTVLGYFCEDDAEELQRRVGGIARALVRAYTPGSDVPTPDQVWEVIKPLRLYSRVGMDNLLVIAERNGRIQPTAFFDRVERQIARHRPALVIIDNAGQTFGGNENDRAQVTAYGNLLNGLAFKHGCAVLLLSHPAKMEGSEYSGSTAWENVARARWRMTIDDAKDIRTLAVQKSNYGGFPTMDLAYDVERHGFVRVKDSVTPEAIQKMKPSVLSTLQALHAMQLAPVADAHRGRKGIYRLARDNHLVMAEDEKLFKATVEAMLKSGELIDGMPLPHLEKAANRQVKRGLVARADGSVGFQSADFQPVADAEEEEDLGEKP